MQQEQTLHPFRTLPRAQQKPIIAAAIREAIENRARAGLTDFSQYTDPTYAKWYRARHLRKIASVLEQVQRRELTRVIINVPPRHLKSSQVVKWEAKLLGDDPTEQIISASRALNLALKFSKQVRRTLQSSRYQSLYPATKIVRGSDSADDWLVEGGYGSSYRAVGTGGGIVGEGATVLVMDDVSDPGKQESETETTGTWEWYKEEARPRLAPNGVVVVVNNRTGVNDLTAHLLDPERNDSADPPYVWTVVNMPAQDAEGNYLWLDRFPIEFYLSLQNDIHLWNVQYQQKPVKSQGNLIKREKAQYIPQLPTGVKEQVRANDLALTIRQTTKHDPDFTAELGAAKHNGFLYLVNPRLYRAEIPEITTNLMSYKMDNPQVRMGMGKALHEKAVAQNLIAAGFPIEPYREKGDVIERMAAFINLWDTGRVILVGDEKKWEAFLNQWCALPQGHDDAGAVAAGVTIMLGYMPTQTEKKKREPSPYAFIDSM